MVSRSLDQGDSVDRTPIPVTPDARTRGEDVAVDLRPDR